MVRPAAQTPVWCDRGRARMPRSTGGAFFRRCRHRWRRPEDTERRDAEHKMRAFIKRFLMHYGIYRRYPLGRFPALRNAWRVAQP